jgi:endo-alpha-1,4-polygalactosaminidase (GH114 family)
VDAIGIEDLFTEGNRAQPRSHANEMLGHLKPATAAGKPVLLIEYGTKPESVQRSVAGARENGLLLLVTDRHLKTLGRCEPAAEAASPFKPPLSRK